MGHASISLGEQVLDLGSGLGVDTFIAAAATGNTGKVVGLDISKKEIEHAQQRANARGLENVNFVNADMEDMPFEDNRFDVIISNGAFCLAPNKEKASKDIFRVLKPGGRFSVCCTTTKTMLDSDDSDSKMTFEDDDLQGDADETDSRRYRIHGNTPEFQHLEEYDMNTLCARVVLHGHKP